MIAGNIVERLKSYHTLKYTTSLKKSALNSITNPIMLNQRIATGATFREWFSSLSRYLGSSLQVPQYAGWKLYVRSLTKIYGENRRARLVALTILFQGCTVPQMN